MLRVTTSTVEELGKVTLKLEGKLAGPWVDEFEQCWRSITEKWKDVTVELVGVTFIDSKGKCLLAKIYGQGARLAGTGLMTKSIIEEICGVDEAERRNSSSSQGPKQGVLRALILLVPLFFCLARARAQEGQPLKLTLKEAVQLALKQNPQVQIANLNLAASLQDRDLARAGLLPQADFESVDRAMRYNIYALFGSKFPGIAQHGGPFQFFQAGPNFSMPIFDLTLWRRWQAAHHGVRASEAQETAVREQTVLLVVSQYLGGLRASAAVVAAQSRVDLAQALYDQASDLQKNGVGTGLDTLRANVELQNEKQRLIEAQTQQEVALYGLARLLNLDPHQKVELADQPSFFQTPEFEASQSIEQALSTRPEMHALEARERIARLTIKAASESRLPSINLSGDWAYQGLSLAEFDSLLHISSFGRRADFHERQDSRRDHEVRPGAKKGDAGKGGPTQPNRPGSEDGHRDARVRAARSGCCQPGSQAGEGRSDPGARPLPGRGGQQHRSDLRAGRLGARQ